GAYGGDDQCRKKHRRCQRKAETLARDRLAVGRIQHRQLLLREDGNGDGYCSCCFGKIWTEKSRGATTGPIWARRRSGRLFLAKIVDELDQLDRRVPILGRRR